MLIKYRVYVDKQNFRHIDFWNAFWDTSIFIQISECFIVQSDERFLREKVWRDDETLCRFHKKATFRT